MLSEAQLKAMKKYKKKNVLTKSLKFHKDYDSDLIAMMNDDEQSFNSLVNTLLREHYGLDIRISFAPFLMK